MTVPHRVRCLNIAVNVCAVGLVGSFVVDYRVLLLIIPGFIPVGRSSV